MRGDRDEPCAALPQGEGSDGTVACRAVAQGKGRKRTADAHGD